MTMPTTGRAERQEPPWLRRVLASIGNATIVATHRLLIYLSGIFEVLLAVAVVAWPHRLYLGSMIIVYLVMIFPSNIYAAVQRISFGGHSMGPRYLLVRSPLQLLLIVWTYWFCVRAHGRPT